MNRRDFLIRTTLLATGGLLAATAPALAEAAARSAKKATATGLKFDGDLYAQFQNPDTRFRPFARWWWNGNKIQREEVVRQLHLLHEAGIGGVEIYPVSLPDEADGMGIPSLKWLGEEWIDMVKFATDEAAKLGMRCDLLVGTGWPFGSEIVPRDERAQVMLVQADKIVGPTRYETSRFHIFQQADPEVTVKVPSRTFELVSLQLAPNPVERMDQVVDLSGQCGQELITIDVPQGEHYLYALVKVHDFCGVINGAPGGDGAVIDHMNAKAINTFLHHITDTMQKRIGPLKGRIRSLMTDSMELEGCNWTTDFAEEFKRRCGYDLMPYLVFTMFKTHRLGDVWEYQYGSEQTPEFKAIIDRVRYDFEHTKAELLDERYTAVYCKWCNEVGVASKCQAYGRAFFPLESSLPVDIPEGESWTTNYLRHRLGEEMPNDDYRRGRGYTMINKYVSSAAHLTGKRVVSCEEMTNTYHVFNATLELLKLGSDMSILSGITQSCYHGFNYSPQDAPYPGWILYGSYYNEKNNWWPYFKYLNAYKARLASLLQNADMYTDMTILTPTADLWTHYGVQTEPFPGSVGVLYTSLLWEAIHKHGGACDYTSEKIIGASSIQDGALCYGPKTYKTLFLSGIEGIEPSTLERLYALAKAGGRIFCVERYPNKALGLKDHEQRDREVGEWVEKLKAMPDRFILLDRPQDDDFFAWYPAVQQRYNLPQYLRFSAPDRYLTQNRYRTDDGTELFFIANSHLHTPHRTQIHFRDALLRGRCPWLLDAHTGKRYRIGDEQGVVTLDLGPADSCLIALDKRKTGERWEPLPVTAAGAQALENWDVELKHGREGWSKQLHMDGLTDLKDTPYRAFMGTAIYRTRFDADKMKGTVLNLGIVSGISQVRLNGKELGVTWYGRRLYDLSEALRPGENELEVSVVTTMGNYMKTLTDNPVAQKWTNRKSKVQPDQSMGLLGPVSLYARANDQTARS